MLNLEFKNEADFLANSNKAQWEMFNKMCKAILSNYSKIAKETIPFDLKRSETIIVLFNKLNHMAFSLYSPQSIPDFLKRIVTKPVKVISKPEYKEQPEIYGKGHFRWDFKAHTLNENELQAIRMYLGLHVATTVAKTKPTYTEKLTWKQFAEIEGYEEKAIAFLSITETTFTSEFKEHAVYFEGDKDSRDIYTCILKNKANRYKFTFGQSINNTGKHPSAYDVLSCLQKYDPGTFDNFCGDFGYDADSRTAYKTYKAVMKEWKNIELLFTPEQLEQLQEIS